MPTRSSTRLVADIGGTNTRIALFDRERGTFQALREYRNADFATLADALARWHGESGLPAPDTACIAAAAYQSGDLLSMVNCPWRFSCSELSQQFGWRQAGWINDFEANAHALPYLGDDQRQVLQAGTAAGASGKLAVVGPGTGFGGASLSPAGGSFLAGSAEPGHMGLSPSGEFEVALFRHLLRQVPDIYVEMLVSGPGLARLYAAVCDLEGLGAEQLTPAEVAERAQAGSDPQCTRALEVFCALFGSACGDFILANGAWGGLYLAGGIPRKILPFLQKSEFLHRLRAKGAMAEHLAAVPVWLVTASHPGLLGAAHAPLN